ncbi:MAG: hypothetical protein FWC64_06475 [Treponema sp.]|nr:hypothetical protein [Treponema sp.]
MKKLISLVFCLAAVTAVAPAFDLWQHPESAGRNSLFASASAPRLVIYNFDLDIVPEFNIDYMLPTRFPFSLGAFIKTPSPNLNSFGARLGYHVNLDRPGTNLYFFYVFDFGFVRNDILVRYGDQPRELRLFDFRAGLRRRINRFLFIQIESDFQFQSFVFGLSAKLF